MLAQSSKLTQNPIDFFEPISKSENISLKVLGFTGLYFLNQNNENGFLINFSKSY